MTTNTLTITRPDDWHLHLRDGNALSGIAQATAKVFARAIVMPNLVPPVIRLADASAYRQRIMAALPQHPDFTPLMTLYLTDNTTASDIAEAAQSGIVNGVKLYPAGATTNSDQGVTDPGNIPHLLEALEKHDLPLLLHGEVTSSDIDIFDREKVFIDRYLQNIRQQFPALRIILEHVTTADAVDFVCEASDLTAATVTPQHLLLNRNDLLAGGLRPHNYCLPVLKRQRHQQRIQQVVASGHTRFFLGTDSAPHTQHKKESTCGCAGCFSAPAALPLYAAFFEQHNALDKLEGFASFYGADFYRLPRNQSTITLKKSPWVVPDHMQIGEETFIPFAAGQTLDWQVAH